MGFDSVGIEAAAFTSAEAIVGRRIVSVVRDDTVVTGLLGLVTGDDGTRVLHT